MHRSSAGKINTDYCNFAISLRNYNYCMPTLFNLKTWPMLRVETRRELIYT